MAIIRFSTLVNNQSISFNPATDVLLFDDATFLTNQLINISCL